MMSNGWSLPLALGLAALLLAFLFRLLSTAIRGLDPENFAWVLSEEDTASHEAEDVERDEAPIVEVLARFVRAARDLDNGAVLALTLAALAASPLVSWSVSGLITLVAAAGVAALLGVFLPEQLSAGREAALLGRAAPVVLALASALHPLSRAADLAALPLAAFMGRPPRPAAAEAPSPVPPPSSPPAPPTEESPQGPQASGLREVLGFIEDTVDEVMTPRAEVVAIESGSSVSDLARVVRTTRRGTYPIYRNSLDEVVGTVALADLLGATPEDKVDGFAREARIVPESKRVAELVEEMREVGTALVLVVDEFGALSGLANLHDLIGVLVGEVVADEEQTGFESRRLDGDTWVLNPLLRIERVSEITGFMLPEGEYQTLAGFILWQLGRIPLAGERLRIEGGEIEILAADERRILTVRLKRTPPERRSRRLMLPRR